MSEKYNEMSNPLKYCILLKNNRFGRIRVIAETNKKT